MITMRLKSFGAVALVTVLAVALSGCPPCIGTAVTFRDRALESAVRAALGQPFGCISADSLRTITELNAAGLGIRNLTGISGCTNLVVLDLSANELQSISELASLTKLTKLFLNDNNIRDITALSGLFQLDELNLDLNPDIRDWSPLVANVTNGGFPSGGIVIVDEAAVSLGNGQFTASFNAAASALREANVEVLLGVGESNTQ